MLKVLINEYKFERRRAAHGALVALMDEILPVLPTNILVVPVPTVSQHRRIRGYGHAELLAQTFARKRGLPYREALARRTNSVQRGASKKERITQAKMAYVAKQLSGEVCLLVDDVYTTGATFEYAARTLREAGAREVWIVTLSRQPLEK